MTVGGAGDQTVRGAAVPHQLQELAEAILRQGEIFADRRQRPAIFLLVGDAEQDQPGDQSLCFLVSVRLVHLSGRVHH